VATGWPAGLPPEHAEISSTEQAAADSTARPHTGDRRRRADVIIVSS
jgi:hypothetical protein